MADLHLEARGRHHVEAEHAVVVVAAQAVGDAEPGTPRPVERAAHVVAVRHLDHDVVQPLGHLERSAGEGDGVVALVAVVEAHLELDALGDLHLEPVGLLHAQALGEEGVRLVERQGGEDGVAEAHPLGEEAAGHERRREGSGLAGEPVHELHPDAPRRHGVHEVGDPPGRPLLVGALVQLVAGGAQPRGERVEGGGVGGLEAQVGGVVGRAGLDDEALHRRVVAPGEGACGRLPRHQPDDVAEER